MNVAHRPEQKGNILIKTGQLAKRAGILPSKVRFYVKEGLLNPVDYTAGGYFLFSEKEAVERIEQISHLQANQRRTLSEIKNALGKAALGSPPAKTLTR